MSPFLRHSSFSFFKYSAQWFVEQNVKVTKSLALLLFVFIFPINTHKTLEEIVSN